MLKINNMINEAKKKKNQVLSTKIWKHCKSKFAKAENKSVKYLMLILC